MVLMRPPALMLCSMEKYEGCRRELTEVKKGNAMALANSERTRSSTAVEIQRLSNRKLMDDGKVLSASEIVVQIQNSNAMQRHPYSSPSKHCFREHTSAL
jgi:hypothetical protein